MIGSLRVFRDKLTICNTPSAHRRIARLLAVLEGAPRPREGRRAPSAHPRPGGKDPSVLFRPPPPPQPFRIPPPAEPARRPAGENKAIAKPVRVLGVETSRVYVLLLIDSSGSMLDILDLLRKQADGAVAQLSDEQFFQVLFHRAGQAVPAFAGKLAPATAENRRKARDFLRKVRAHGRTHAVGALQAACRALAAANGSESQVIFFFTDGHFADNEAVLTLAREMAEKLKVVIHPVTCREVEKEGLAALRKLAEATGGTCIVLPAAE